MKRKLFAFLCGFLLAFVISCSEEKATGEKVEDGIGEVGNDIEEGVEEVGDEIDKATDDN